MAGGSGRIIGGGGVDTNIANVINGRLQVDSTGGGGGGGGPVTQATVPWIIQEPLSVDDNGGSLTIDGAVTVSNFPVVQPVSDNGGSLTIDGAVTVSNFPGVQPVSDNGGSLTVDGAVTVSNFPAVQPVSDNGGSLTVDGAVTVSNFPGVQTVSDNALKNEGAVASDPSRPVLAVRDDVLALPAGVLDGDFTFLRVDDVGALWTRDREQTMILSGSTNGQPIQITGTNTGGAVTIHNPGAGNTDQVWIYVTNTSTSNLVVTIEFGGTGVGNEIDIIVGCNDTLLLIAGATVAGNSNVRVYGSVASVANVFGYARRVA